MNSHYRNIILATLLSVIASYSITARGNSPVEKNSGTQTMMDAKKQLVEEITRRTGAGELMPEQVANPPHAVAYCSYPKPPQNAAVLQLGLQKNYVCDNSDAGKKVIAWRAWYCNNKTREKLCVLGRWDSGLPSYSGRLNTNVAFVSSGINVVFKHSSWRP